MTPPPPFPHCNTKLTILLTLKLQQITRPRLAIQKTLENQVLFGVESGVFRQKKVLKRVSIRVSMLVFGQIRVGLEFVLSVSKILGYHYQASTRLRLQSFGSRHDNEPRVGTPLRRNLVGNA